jgi:hypothetical protein
MSGCGQAGSQAASLRGNSEFPSILSETYPVQNVNLLDHRSEMTNVFEQAC